VGCLTDRAGHRLSVELALFLQLFQLLLGGLAVGELTYDRPVQHRAGPVLRSPDRCLIPLIAQLFREAFRTLLLPDRQNTYGPRKIG